MATTSLTASSTESAAAEITSDTSSGWHRCYRRELATREIGSGYVWMHGRFFKQERGIFFQADGSDRPDRVAGYKPLEEARAESINSYCAHLSKRIGDINLYIEQQRARIENWEPRPLLTL